MLTLANLPSGQGQPVAPGGLSCSKLRNLPSEQCQGVGFIASGGPLYKESSRIEQARAPTCCASKNGSLAHGEPSSKARREPNARGQSASRAES